MLNKKKVRKENAYISDFVFYLGWLLYMESLVVAEGRETKCERTKEREEKKTESAPGSIPDARWW